MIFGVDVSQHQLTWDELLARIRFAEDAGFESAWVFDHFTPLYGDRRGPCLEAYTLLAALAPVTTRIRLGALVTGVTYRHPAVLAAEVVTVDHVSGGRVNLGMGAAWHADEHRRLGIDFPPVKERAGRLDEALHVVKRLWTEDAADFDGRYYQLRGGYYHPRPVQRPHPPVWVGAMGDRLTLPIAGRHADVWHGFGSPEVMSRKWEIVRRAAEGAGRDPAGIARSTNLSLSEPWDEVRQRVDEVAEAGVSHLIASWPAEGWPRMEEFATKVLPTLA
jgi:F420-dependent oxidoreductase-like protein